MPKTAEDSYGRIYSPLRSLFRMLSKGLIIASLVGAALIGLSFAATAAASSFGVSIPFTLPLIPVVIASGSALLAGLGVKIITDAQDQSDFKKIGRVEDETKKRIDNIEQNINKGIAITPRDWSKVSYQQEQNRVNAL